MRIADTIAKNCVNINLWQSKKGDRKHAAAQASSQPENKKKGGERKRRENFQLEKKLDMKITFGVSGFFAAEETVVMQERQEKAETLLLVQSV